MNNTKNRIKTIEEITKEVELSRWYAPSEIAQAQWIVNTKNKGDYWMILKLIRMDKLKSRNFGAGIVPYYMISGEEILSFIKNRQG